MPLEYSSSSFSLANSDTNVKSNEQLLRSCLFDNIKIKLLLTTLDPFPLPLKNHILPIIHEYDQLTVFTELQSVFSSNFIKSLYTDKSFVKIDYVKSIETDFGFWSTFCPSFKLYGAIILIHENYFLNLKETKSFSEILSQITQFCAKISDVRSNFHIILFQSDGNPMFKEWIKEMNEEHFQITLINIHTHGFDDKDNKKHGKLIHQAIKNIVISALKEIQKKLFSIEESAESQLVFSHATSSTYISILDEKSPDIAKKKELYRRYKLLGDLYLLLGSIKNAMSNYLLALESGIKAANDPLWYASILENLYTTNLLKAMESNHHWSEILNILRAYTDKFSEVLNYYEKSLGFIPWIWAACRLSLILHLVGDRLGGGKILSQGLHWMSMVPNEAEIIYGYTLLARKMDLIGWQRFGALYLMKTAELLSQKQTKPTSNESTPLRLSYRCHQQSAQLYDDKWPLLDQYISMKMLHLEALLGYHQTWLYTALSLLHKYRTALISDQETALIDRMKKFLTSIHNPIIFRNWDFLKYSPIEVKAVHMMTIECKDTNTNTADKFLSRSDDIFIYTPFVRRESHSTKVIEKQSLVEFRITVSNPLSSSVPVRFLYPLTQPFTTFRWMEPEKMDINLESHTTRRLISFKGISKERTSAKLIGFRILIFDLIQIDYFLCPDKGYIWPGSPSDFPVDLDEYYKSVEKATTETEFVEDDEIQIKDDSGLSSHSVLVSNKSSSLSSSSSSSSLSSIVDEYSLNESNSDVIDRYSKLEPNVSSHQFTFILFMIGMKDSNTPLTRSSKVFVYQFYSFEFFIRNDSEIHDKSCLRLVPKIWECSKNESNSDLIDQGDIQISWSSSTYLPQLSLGESFSVFFKVVFCKVGSYTIQWTLYKSSPSSPDHVVIHNKYVFIVE